MSPTRLEGMETCGGANIIVPVFVSPTRLEGMETQTMLDNIKDFPKVSDPP